jgi:hypothetical protein
MQRLPTLTLAASLCLLAACSGSAPARPVAPPPSLTVPCAEPVRLGARDMTQAEVETAWGRDRTALRTCGDQHAALADYLSAVSAR